MRPLVPALRAVVPRPRRAARRAGRRGRPRHPVPMGAAVHPAAGRGGPPGGHALGDRWFVDETYVKVAGRWRYVYRASTSTARSSTCSLPYAGTQGSAALLSAGPRQARVPVESPRTSSAYTIATGRAAAGTVIETEQYADDRIEADHPRLKARLRPMRGLERDRTPWRSSLATPSSRTSDAATTSWLSEEPASRRIRSRVRRVGHQD